jgi:hypothetical protein
MSDFTIIFFPLFILGACSHALFAGFWAIFASFTDLTKPTFRALGFGAGAVTIAMVLEALVILPFVIADVKVSINDIETTVISTCLLAVFFSVAGACFANRQVRQEED